MAKYKFVGVGMGVPGLPHEISDEDAEEMGVTEILSEAVRNGNYVVADENPHPVPLPKKERGLNKE